MARWSLVTNSASPLVFSLQTAWCMPPKNVTILDLTAFQLPSNFSGPSSSALDFFSFQSLHVTSSRRASLTRLLGLSPMFAGNQLTLNISKMNWLKLSPTTNMNYQSCLRHLTLPAGPTASKEVFRTAAAISAAHSWVLDSK